MDVKVEIPLEVLVNSIGTEAEGVVSLDLRSPIGDQLPSFTAGSHIDLHLDNGLVRSYSLTNSQAERHRYKIAVREDKNGRGGSRFVHESIRPGNTLKVSAPKNNFPLEESAKSSTLLAGGIGITPIWSMIQRLEQLRSPWELYFCARSRQTAAFLDELESLQRSSQIHLNFDDESDGNSLDIEQVVASASLETHLYCCGPASMLAAFEHATSVVPRLRVHTEYFNSSEAPATSGGFTVTLARRSVTISIPRGRTILDVLLDEGIDVPYSCKQGVCGTCETGVLSGIPDHRDLLLSKEEKTASKTMMLCCSGARSQNLVLDL